MIAFLRGTVYAFGTDYVILDVGGVGYQVYFNHSQPVTLGQELFLHTYQQIREDAQVLYGFIHPMELELFKRLISVKGLGPKTALGMLTAAGYEAIVGAIEQGEVAFLKKMPGIGAKTASQIVLDLKGKLVHEEEAAGAKGEMNDKLQDVLDVLRALGYKTQELNAIMKPLKEAKLDTDEAYVKLGLQLLLKRKGG